MPVGLFNLFADHSRKLCKKHDMSKQLTWQQLLSVKVTGCSWSVKHVAETGLLHGLQVSKVMQRSSQRALRLSSRNNAPRPVYCCRTGQCACMSMYETWLA